MAIKDYYAILMVHPKAELFVIEAAYKRLAREYHPDFTNTPAQHEKMVEINEAYEILSDPARRKRYDKEYARQARREQLAVSVAATSARPPVPPSQQAQTSKKTAAPKWGAVGPVRPDPAAYGIEADYLERASEGAQAWQQREHRIPSKVKWGTRILGSLAGIAISLVLWPWGEKYLLFAWLLLPLSGEIILRLIEQIRDRHLLRYKFNPLYNPNPAGYHKFAQAWAQYEADTVTVYVGRDAIYHLAKTCPGMSSYEPMPKWFAHLRNARRCSRCGRIATVRAKKLPRPFGRGK
jgi:hypothetical protein